MCGIAGYFSNRPLDPVDWRPRLQQSMDCMAARGPDDEGAYFQPHCGLGHRRLAIIDLKGGRQPLEDPQTGAVIIFNGEIYNYREIRPRLEAAGRTFRTQSDTEVLLHAYQEWGPQCLDELLGMFAFAIYTPADGSLFLARDRLGVKPLFFGVQQGILCFASGMRPLLHLLPQMPNLNVTAISHYLSTIRVNLGDTTLLQGVSLLEPGTCIRFSKSGDISANRYWEPPCLAPGDKPDIPFDEATAKLRDLMQSSVDYRLISDVPLGGFLSGGLDSTVIAAIASERSGHQFHAYNVGYPQPGYNEFPFVTEAAERYAMQCRQIELDARAYPEDWQRLVYQNALPLSTPNEVPIYLLSKHTRADYTVALSGEGADEVFGGYTIAYFSGYDYDRAARTAPTAETFSPTEEALMRGYGQRHLSSLTEQHFLLNSWLGPNEKRKWLHPDISRMLEGDGTMRRYYDHLFEKHPQASTMDKIMLTHLRINLEGLLLRVDSSSMAASIEARVPFTDHRLVEFAFTLPDSYRLDWINAAARQQGQNLNVSEINQMNLLESKRVLRHAYADQVPESILRRPKMSFPVPVFDWMTDWMKPLTKEIISGSPLRSTLFDPVVIDNWLNDRRPLHPVKLWPIVNLCLWHTTLLG